MTPSAIRIAHPVTLFIISRSSKTVGTAHSFWEATDCCFSSHKWRSRRLPEASPVHGWDRS